MRMLVPLGQVQPPVVIVEAQEALLDERKQGRVIPYGVRHVVRLRKRGDSEKRKAESQLIKAGAFLRVRACRVRRQSRTKQLRILYAGVRGAERVGGALCTCTWLLA